MLKFTKVILHNFLSYKDAELNLDNQGVTLVEGTNNSNDAYTSSGSGKSSLLSAITYALYGKTVTGLSGNAVINTESGTDCCVELDFLLDKDSYVIKRFRKGKKGNANKVRLYLNDNEITEATNAKTDKAIQDLIGIQFNTYVNTISYGSSNEPVFSQATDKGKKEILENLANTGVYAKAKDIAYEELKEFKHKLESKESLKSLITNKIDTFKELAMQDEKRYKEEQSRQEANKATLERLKADKDNYAKESKKRRSELKKGLNELIKEEPQSDSSTKLESAYANFNKISVAISRVRQLIKNSNDEIVKLREQYKQVKVKTVCPVCGHVLDKAHKQQELTKIVNQAKEYQEQIDKNKQILSRLVIMADKQKQAVSSLQQEVNNYNSKYKAYQGKLQNIKNKLAEIDRKKDSFSEQVKALESMVQFDVVPTKCYNKDIKIEQEKQAKVERDITKLKEKIENYTVLVNKVFSKEGITSVVLDLITPYLNEHANYYLNKLSGSILSIDMNTQKLNADNTLSDKFDLRVQNRAGADSYQNCSAGERKRIDIAIAFAIQDLQQDHSSTATNIAIYDECFDGLDSVGCESVIEILKEKAKTISSIFVITHNDTLKPLFDNAISVVKDKQGISRIHI